MDEPLAVALKFGFLAVLYLFLLWVARSAIRDLRRYEGSSVAEPVDAPNPGRSRRAGPDLRAKARNGDSRPGMRLSELPA